MKQMKSQQQVFGRPLDKKTPSDLFVESLAGTDIRTPSEASKHQREVWFNKTFGR